MNKVSSRFPVGIYARVSSYKQIGGRFTSSEAQLEVCRNFVNQHEQEGWYEEESFEDNAYSGKNMNRPGMRRLKEAIAAGRIKVVVAYKIERLLRSTEEWPIFQRFLQEHGCQLVSVSEGVADDSASGMLHSHMLVGYAAFERKNIAEKVSSKLRLQAARGFWNGGNVPYGYSYDTKAKQLHPDPIEAPLVKRVFAKAAELVSLTQIAEELNSEGVRTRERVYKTREGSERRAGNHRIRSDWLRLLIRNQLYRGVIRYNRAPKRKTDNVPVPPEYVEHPGRHEALVTKEVWEAANAAVQKTLQPARCKLRSERDRHFHVLKGLLFCQECGRAMVPHASGKLDAAGKPYRYYTCGNVLKERADAACRVRQVSAVGVEACVIGLLGQMARHPKIVQAVLDSGRTRARTEVTEVEERLAALDRDIRQATKQTQNLIDALASGGVSVLGDELRERVAKVKTDKDAMLVERARLQQERDALRGEQMAPEKICVELRRFDTLWERMSNEEKRELVMLLIARVEIRSDSAVAHGNSRQLLLRVKLHLPELGIQATARKQIRFDATIQLRGGSAVDIMAPFKHRIVVASQPRRRPKKAFALEMTHPIHRALALEKALTSDASLTPQALAKRENLSPATVSQLRKLTRLSPAVRSELLKITDRARAWRYSIRRLLPLVGLSPAKQWERYTEIGTGRRIRRVTSAAKSLGRS